MFHKLILFLCNVVEGSYEGIENDYETNINGCVEVCHSLDYLFELMNVLI